MTQKQGSVSWFRTKESKWTRSIELGRQNMKIKNEEKKKQKRQSHTFSATKSMVNGLFPSEKPENLWLQGVRGPGFLVVGIGRRRGIVVVDLPGNLVQQGFTLGLLVLVVLRHHRITDQWKRLEGIRNSPFHKQRVCEFVCAKSKVTLAI